MGTCFGTTIYEEIESSKVTKINVHNVYNLGGVVGSGVTCNVLRASHKQNPDDQVAIKAMNRNLSVAKELYHREVDILTKLSPKTPDDEPHHGILPLISHGEDDNKYYIITRLLHGGELFDRIVSKNIEHQITEKVAIKLVLNMLESVKYCHDNNVIHRDLKPENFVFMDKGSHSDLVLIDFGCAQIVEDDQIVNDIAGTAYYLAPELAAATLANCKKKGTKISEKIPLPKPRTGRILKKSEVWPIGVMAFVMMTGRAPFRGKDNIAIYQSTCLKTLKFPKKHVTYDTKLKLSPNFKDFIQKTLTKDPNKRISIDDAMRHPWVQGVNASDYRGG